jgi:hypothetical protein
MPIVGPTLNLEYRLLPLTLNADGSSMVYLRKGFTTDTGFQVLETLETALTVEETQVLLLAEPTPGKNRSDDLSDAVYQLLLDKGVVSGSLT